jgi:hypothetical protein
MMFKTGLFTMTPLHRLLLLALVFCLSTPAAAVEESDEGKVLTMTGLKRDPVKLNTEAMQFTGLRRHGTGTSSPTRNEKSSK